MEIKNNPNIKTTEIKPLPVPEKKPVVNFLDKVDLKLTTKDYFAQDFKLEDNKKAMVYDFVDNDSKQQPKDKFTIKVEPFKKEDTVKANYDEKNRVLTVETGDNRLRTKTSVDEKTQLMSTQITADNIKITGNYDVKGSELKTLGFESSSTNTNIKTLFDPKKENINGEIKQRIGNQNIKLSSDYNTATSDLKKISLETSNDNTNIKTLFDPTQKNLSGEIKQKIGSQNIRLTSDYNTATSDLNKIALETSGANTNIKTLFNATEKSLGGELIEKVGSDSYKLTGKYNIGEVKNNKLGVEYGNNKGLKITSDFTETMINKEINFNVSNHGLEVTTKFDMDKNFNLDSIQIAKPLSFGDNIPSVKVSAGYDNKTGSFNKVALDLNANIDKKVTVSYSTNLAQSAKQHAVKVNYDVYNNTKISVEANVDGAKKENSGYSVSFSTGFKF